MNIGMALTGYGNAIPQIDQHNSSLQQQEQAKYALQQLALQAQAQKLGPGAMAAYLAGPGGQATQQPIPVPNQGPQVMGPNLPSGGPGGVSPQGPSLPAGGGASGGAGPMAPVASPSGGGGAPSIGGQPSPNDTFARQRTLLQFLAQSGAPPEVQSVALENTLKTILPQERLNDAILGRQISGEYGLKRTELAGDNAMARTKLSTDTRLQIAKQTAANKSVINGGREKLKDDPQFRAKEDILKSATNVYNQNQSDENLQAYHDASKDLADYVKGTSKSASADTGAGAPAEAPADHAGTKALNPADGKPVPDGTIADDPATGKSYVAKGGVWQSSK